MQSKKTTNIDDAELIRRIVSNNDTALFGKLYDRHAKLVYNVCLSIIKDKQETEDVTHDVFLKLFIHLKKFNGKSKFSTWLYRFTYNFCLNHIQRNVKKTYQISDEYNVPDHKDEDVLSLKVEHLAIALEQVNPEDNMILLMKFQSNMSIQDIMQSLNIGESAVKMRLKRAKAKVIEAYSQISQPD